MKALNLQANVISLLVYNVKLILSKVLIIVIVVAKVNDIEIVIPQCIGQMLGALKFYLVYSKALLIP